MAGGALAYIVARIQQRVALRETVEIPPVMSAYYLNGQSPNSF
jgi:hypothetical protein